MQNFKGTTKIELFDLNGDIVQTVEHDNHVTPYITNYYQLFMDEIQAMPYPYNMGLPFVFNNALDSVIGKDLIGLTLNNKTYDTANCPSRLYMNEITGHAGGTFAGTSIRRGSLNTIQSAAVDNGYKWVWDFPTTAANGKISS